MRKATVLLLLLFALAANTAYATNMRLRAVVYRTHPCLARIIDREDPSWDPTISWRGGHNVKASYGLGQADPGTKMAPFGRAWRTSPWVQLRWMVHYADGRYGSECGAWAYWQAHDEW